ncbi:sulfatase-like hydrolase/transferase [Rhodobacteraceae bacterium 2CG4]|uniref:Sulfatase-like hydrolase/transferase n=1 Tax=Halovulum marinum TaxID=2662447 RepID=A0A6L5YWF2_9RHOB|nr:sulfatase [Halovulum marinum]MSU88703.1 sulfatase-like hydrolase/transferase [Halovulum marinum]
MRSILVLFDSLNARALSCYGGAVPTPNFDRLAARTTVFDTHYVGSMPCMPARRDLQTGRLNFLHRSWGPLEPFDVTLTGQMAGAGIHSHLVTDHYHYFEAGGATYHTAFTTWDVVRGQEADPWAFRPADLDRLERETHPHQFEGDRKGYRLQGALNRARILGEKAYPCAQTFDGALAFLDAHRDTDDWFLQIETFDPHEPFIAPPEIRERFPTGYDGPTLDWPRYQRSGALGAAEEDELRANYTALVAHCDAQLGRLLDRMDAENLWDDTALIVTTDHGFLLGEHDWWGKNRMPFWDEIARIPLFLHAPGHPRVARCGALTQTMDLMPTLLDLHGLEIPDTVLGTSVLPALGGGAVRDLALYGIFGGALNATDGRHSYFLYPPDMEAAPLHEYTLMPQHAVTPFTAEELGGARLHEGFGFTGMPLLKIPALPGAKRPPMQGGGIDNTGTALCDLAADPGQTRPFRDAGIEAVLRRAIAAEMQRHEAPPELYERFELESH